MAARCEDADSRLHVLCTPRKTAETKAYCALVREMPICEALDISLKLVALLDVGDFGAEQVSARRVDAGDLFTPDGAYLESDNTVGQVKRDIQAMIAAAKAFIDNRGRDDHRQTGGAEVARLAHEDQRLERLARVGVEQRQISQKLDLTLHFEPAHAPAFDRRSDLVQTCEPADREQAADPPSGLVNLLFDVELAKPKRARASAFSGRPVVA